MSPASFASPEEAVRGALASNAATRALADAPLSPLRGGLSNHAWRADRSDRSYFVRLGGPDASSLGVNRATECNLLAAVSAVGLAPPMIACDPANGLLVTHFVAGCPWSRADARAPANLDRMARRLRTLHALPRPNGVHRVDFAGQARRLRAEIDAIRSRGHAEAEGTAGAAPSCDAAPSSLESVHRAADRALERLAQRRTAEVVCHNDLHHLNVLDDGCRLWLVDWEYGGIGDPVFDLASFACQHELDAGERNALLAAYSPWGAIGAQDLDAACLAFDYVQWLWYRLWIVRNPSADSEYAVRAATLAGRLASASG